MKLENYKISIIMQSFLGEYPNSRKNPEIKFIRAIKSKKKARSKVDLLTRFFKWS